MGCAGWRDRVEKKFWDDAVRKMKDKNMRWRENSGRREVCKGVGWMSWKGGFSDAHIYVEDIFY
jgi:hypothetical protein